VAKEEVPEVAEGAARVTHRVFLLSPADCSGKRARYLQNETAEFELAVRLRRPEGAALGEVFAFVSSLYFRGKLAYARAFARPRAIDLARSSAVAGPRGNAEPAASSDVASASTVAAHRVGADAAATSGVGNMSVANDGIFVITPCDGLLPPDTIVRAEDLRRYAGVPVNADETRYTTPFLRDLEALQVAWSGTQVVLLGSVASPKYKALLTAVLGERLVFPIDFVGRGDMSRGGLLLRCAAEGRELPYAPVLGTQLHGSRPAKLPPLRKLA
jgi:hypothetical protein